jgi:hypothetical protein
VKTASATTTKEGLTVDVLENQQPYFGCVQTANGHQYNGIFWRCSFYAPDLNVFCLLDSTGKARNWPKDYWGKLQILSAELMEDFKLDRSE